jgi:hypothetical protein
MLPDFLNSLTMTNYTSKIVPERYVFHVTSKNRRTNILKKGLIGSTSKGIGYKNAIFAHNSPIITLQWYPFILDLYEWQFFCDIHPLFEPDSADLINEALNRYYDIWAIDTYQLKKTWYVDNIGEKDFGGSPFKNKDLYILTHGAIPSNAIFFCQPQIQRKRIYLDAGWIEMRHLLLPGAA